MKRTIQGKRLCFAPNRITVVCCDSNDCLKEEVSTFKDFLQEKGWSGYVQIGRFDDMRNIFDFKINTIYLNSSQSIEIAKFFLEKGFLLDEEWSEPGAVQKLKAVI